MDECAGKVPPVEDTRYADGDVKPVEPSSLVDAVGELETVRAERLSKGFRTETYRPLRISDWDERLAEYYSVAPPMPRDEDGYISDGCEAEAGERGEDAEKLGSVYLQRFMDWLAALKDGSLDWFTNTGAGPPIMDASEYEAFLKLHAERSAIESGYYRVDADEPYAELLTEIDLRSEHRHTGRTYACGFPLDAAGRRALEQLEAADDKDALRTYDVSQQPYKGFPSDIDEEPYTAREIVEVNPRTALFLTEGTYTAIDRQSEEIRIDDAFFTEDGTLPIQQVQKDTLTGSPLFMLGGVTAVHAYPESALIAAPFAALALPGAYYLSRAARTTPHEEAFAALQAEQVAEYTVVLETTES